MSEVFPWLTDLDEKQREIVTITENRHQLINAGPGSGKTRVLVAHYLHLLMMNSDWAVDSVVAITFTEKAATEMRERIGEKLRKLVHDAPKKEWQKRARELLDCLPEAPIGTIHSFCARLLRTFALEAGLDPSFTILDELQAQTLRQSVSERWLWEALQTDEDAQQVVAYWGFEKAVELLTELLNRRLLIEHRRANGEPLLYNKMKQLGDPEEALQRCYEKIACAYKREESERNALDYDDLLLRTWRLLCENETVRKHVRQSYKRLLVDELQDTDRIQMKIFQLICGWDEGESGNRVLFFGVGDSQQSIYAFRNADVSVFNELWEKRQAGWHCHRLDRNYRSVKPLVALTNHAFERIFVTSESDATATQLFRTRFQRMESVRDDPSTYAPVEIALLPASGGNKWQRLRREAQWVAKRIRELCENEGIKYSDIAILLKELIHVTIFEDALRRCDIPYHVIAGYGFFETIEARDLLTFLQVLAEPDDDVALAAWLRSPMVGVSDETLLALSKIGWDLDGEVELPESERAKLHRAKELLKQARERAERDSVRSLLEWLLRETRYDALVTALPHGRQRLANIRKFLRMAQELNEGLLLNIRGIVRYARALVEGEARIGEQPLAGAVTSAVQVMTIHAAKGLEFPCVIVPMLGEVGAPRGSSASLVADPDLGVAVRLYNEAGESLGREEMPNFRAVDEQRKERERAELERLLFVACTRARDRLILVGTRDKEGSRSEEGGWSNWLQMLVSALSLPVGNANDQTISVADDLSVRLRLTDEEDAERESLASSYAPSKPPFTWLEGEEAPPDLPLPDVHLPLATPTVIRLSVSDLLPSMEANGKGSGEEQVALELGLVVHALLRYGIVEPDEQQLLWVAQSVGADAERVLQRAEDLKSFVKRAKSSRAFQQAQRAQRSRHELEFRFRLEGDPVVELTGRWDLIAELPDRWLVVDFKTDAVKSSQEAQERFNAHYEWQALAYAFAVHRVFGASQVEVIFLFVALDEPCEVSRVFNEAEWASLEERLRQRALEVEPKTNAQGV
jgi:ATP-dependent helicase/nuclease subunit A